MADDVLARLEATIRARRGGDPGSSYVASLFAKGRPAIARKVGEEATETVIAALAEPDTLTAEAADLVFHLLVLLADAGSSLADVTAELARREGLSGHEEKARRFPTPFALSLSKGVFWGTCFDKLSTNGDGSYCETAMPVDATLPYDDTNIFARILRGEIPAARLYEDEWAIAFADINPQAPTHILVVPTGAYVSWDDFSARASDAEIAGFVRAVGRVARDAGLVDSGYRLLANTGPHSHQEVPHLHVHILAGRPLGPMLAKHE